MSILLRAYSVDTRARTSAKKTSWEAPITTFLEKIFNRPVYFQDYDLFALSAKHSDVKSALSVSAGLSILLTVCYLSCGYVFESFLIFYIWLLPVFVYFAVWFENYIEQSQKELREFLIMYWIVNTGLLIYPEHGNFVELAIILLETHVLFCYPPEPFSVLLSPALTVGLFLMLCHVVYLRYTAKK